MAKRKTYNAKDKSFGLDKNQIARTTTTGDAEFASDLTYGSPTAPGKKAKTKKS